MFINDGFFTENNLQYKLKALKLVRKTLANVINTIVQYI